MKRRRVEQGTYRWAWSIGLDDCFRWPSAKDFEAMEVIFGCERRPVALTEEEEGGEEAPEMPLEEADME
jgi:hypothetical protein